MASVKQLEDGRWEATWSVDEEDYSSTAVFDTKEMAEWLAGAAERSTADLWFTQSSWRISYTEPADFLSHRSEWERHRWRCGYRSKEAALRVLVGILDHIEAGLYVGPLPDWVRPATGCEKCGGNVATFKNDYGWVCSRCIAALRPPKSKRQPSSRPPDELEKRRRQLRRPVLCTTAVSVPATSRSANP